MPEAVRHVKTEYWLTLLLVGSGIAIFLPKLAAVVLIDHDDIISVIGATCNQGRYEAAIPSGRWVSATEWQQYWQLDTFGCFEQISHDLAHYDIHPPLYFWLLHICFSVFGVSVMSGLVLNLGILLITAIIIYASCRLLSVSNFLSFVTALAWMLSLPSRTAIGVIRPYTLFSMLTALLLLLVILWLKSDQTRYVFGLGIVLTAGFLTHYQFVVPAGSATIFAVAILSRRHKYKEITQLLVAAAAAAFIFYLSHPDFLTSVWRADAQAQSFTLAGFLQRMVAVAGTVLQTFNPLDWSHPLPYGLLDWSHPLYLAINVLNLVLGAASAYLAMRLAIRAFKTRALTPDTTISVNYLPILTAVTSWSVIVAVYVFCVSPVHAIGLQYLHFVTPFLFIGVAQAAEVFKETIPHSVVVALPIVLVVSAIFATALFVGHRSEQQRILEIKNAEALIVDSDKIGILPTVLWYANPTTKVYAAMQDKLLTKFADLATTIDGKSYFVSSDAYGNTSDKREVILERLSGLRYGNPVRQHAGVVPLIPLGGDIYAFEHLLVGGSDDPGSATAVGR
jgi:hypothetical protein